MTAKEYERAIQRIVGWLRAEEILDNRASHDASRTDIGRAWFDGRRHGLSAARYKLEELLASEEWPEE